MSEIKYVRRIIGVEAQLGFMFIPAKGQSYLPHTNARINVYCTSNTTSCYELSYNAQHNRIFGLSGWYKENNITEGTFLDIKIENENVYISTQCKENKTNSENDSSNLSSAMKGNIMEDRIKELILLLGQGMLNVYKPVIDNEGIDLIVLKRGQFHPIFLQIKSRYNAIETNKMTLTLSRTFKPHHSYYIIGAVFNMQNMEIENKILFIPSHIVEEKGLKLNDNTWRIPAAYNPNSKDQWSEYWVDKEHFVQKLIEKFAELETILK